MKIVQSLWSKPILQNKKSLFNIGNGGWAERKFYYMSWALSCLQFKKYYKDLVLVTDKAGKKLLIDKLNLPYSEIIIGLDEINSYDKDFWALGKILAYSMIKEPFIHADGDVFIWDKFDTNIKNAELIAQNSSVAFPQDKFYFSKILSQLKFVPSFILDTFQSSTSICSISAGIIGGNDIDFFQEYKNRVFEFLNKNKEIQFSDKQMTRSYNNVYEEYFFCCLAKAKKKNITFLLKNIDPFSRKLINFDELGKNSKYIHPIGSTKKIEHVPFNVENRLRLYYPNYYNLINRLLQKCEI